MPPPPPVRVRLPGWIPDDRPLNAILVVAVAIGAAAMAFQGPDTRTSQSPPATEAAQSAVLAAPTVTDTAPQATIAPTPAPALVIETRPADPAMAPASPAPALAVATEVPATSFANVVAAPLDVALLPQYRIVTFYGHPHDPNMGIVGEISIEELAQKVKQEAANYAAADPSRPVIPAFELIATVAQRVPGADGTYILDTDHETLSQYIDYAAEQGMLVFLDLQIGRGTVPNEIEKVRDLLARPNVHLALDPEFAVAEGQIPGEYIGSIPAESVVYAQQVLAEISAEHGLPPKILIVHQFREDMIQGKEQLAPYPGVQLVIDADGYGAPELKTAVYNFLVRDEPVEFAGVKLFYRQDLPLMSPQEILALVPAPDVIIYQ